MRYSPKQYAQAFLEAVNEKKGKEAEEMVNNFFVILKKNNDLSFIDDIIKELEEIISKREGVLKGEIIFARKMDIKVRHSIEKKLIEKKVGGVKAKEINWVEKIDDKLIGGFVARIGEVSVDASIKTTLDKMKRELKSAIN